jgi:molybdenum cofactor cytidylyltransferase
MLSSVKAGLKSLPTDTNAALIVLGDQPQIEVVVVEQIVEKYMSTKGRIIVPSYHRHRGHPWLVDRYYWEAISQLSLTITLREFLQEREEQILYVDVDTSSILEDLDTPQDYLNHRPGD